MRFVLASAALLLFMVGPFAWQAAASLQPEGALTLDSYTRVFQSGFLRSLWNSFIVSGATTVLAVLVAAPAAFAIAKLPFSGKRLFLAAVLAISMFPTIATVSPLYLMVRAVGLRDTLIGLVIPYSTFALPLALWILTSFFREIPDELYRAARVDGCSGWQTFWRVFMPLAAPGLATTGILVFISAWNEFLYALTFISSPDKRTVPVAISLFASEYAEPWSEIAAASIVSTLPLLVLTVLFQRRIVSGLTAGAVKG